MSSVATVTQTAPVKPAPSSKRSRRRPLISLSERLTQVQLDSSDGYSSSDEGAVARSICASLAPEFESKLAFNPNPSQLSFSSVYEEAPTLQEAQYREQHHHAVRQPSDDVVWRDDCETPQLSLSSRSTSMDSLTDAYDGPPTPTQSSAHLPSAATPMPSPTHSPTASVSLASPTYDEAIVPQASSSRSGQSSDSETEDEADPLALAFPLKVVAFALALLPIFTSFFARMAPSPPPLPVEVPARPKTCKSVL